MITFLATLWPWCLRVWRWRWQLLLALSLAAHGLTLHRLKTLQHTATQRELRLRQQVLAQSERMRAVERAQAERTAHTAALAAQEQARADQELDTLRQRLRAGTERVRDRFVCEVPAAADTATAAGSTDGSTHTGFTDADADVALGIAADGDAAIRERNLAIALAEQYRQACEAGSDASR